MQARWASLLRVITQTAKLLAVAFTTAVVATAAILCAAVLGGQPRMLQGVVRAVVRTVGGAFAGQHTDQIEVAVQVFPDTQRLQATTKLKLRSLEDKHPRFLFLLNPALKLRGVRSEAAESTNELAVYRLSWFTLVEPKQPLAKDQTLTVTFDYEGTFPANSPDPIPTQIDPQSVILGPETFWYPTDAQSFFEADVQLTMPRSLTVVHNSGESTRVERGDLQVVRWKSTRRVGSIPIIAGHFHLSERRVGDVGYRLFVAEDIDLDTKSVLDNMERANRFLSAQLGPSGFDTVSVYVTRNLRRGVNYGTGLIGMSVRYFRNGDDGFALLAHEIAHNWWGGLVTEHRLQPGTGGQWIVEGLAELSSLLATEEAFGVDALTRRLASEFFDPEKQFAIRDMSIIDNVLNEAKSRDTIYRKGSYAAYRLCSLVGREACFTALRQLVEAHRYTAASDVDVQKAFEAVAGRSLEEWFADSVRSDALADLELSGNDKGDVIVTNKGKARLGTDTLPLWIFSGGQWTPTSVHVGDKLGVPAESYAILDPQLLIADVVRSNNRFPALSNPLHAQPGPDHRLLLTSGEPWPWSAQTISLRHGNTQKQSWQLQRGSLQPPTWFPDGKQVLVSYSDPTRPLPTILALAEDGTRRTVASGTSPAIAADGSIFTARKNRIVRIAPDSSESTVAKREGWVVDQPLPSPLQRRVAYLAARNNRLEIRLVDLDDNRDRVLLTADRDRTVLRWSPTGDKLYALLGWNWDWRIVEIPLDDSSASRVVVRDAAAIGDFAVSPDGSHLALTAAAERVYPVGRKHLYILALDPGAAPREIDVPDLDLETVTWNGNENLLVIGAQTASAQPWILPQTRLLKVVSLGDGSIKDLP